MKPAVIKNLSETKIQIERMFDAPVESVWKPFTDASLIRQWMIGPPGWSMPVCKIDFRVNGIYENIFRNKLEGTEIAIAGTFRDIVTHQKIVQDEQHKIGSSEGAITNKTVVIITFEPVSESTCVKTLIEYGSKKERDEALATGMEVAMEMGYCRIDNLLNN
jgi:uncharacterized protein YndB with AHSA1/START domain